MMLVVDLARSQLRVRVKFRVRAICGCELGPPRHVPEPNAAKCKPSATCIFPASHGVSFCIHAALTLLSSVPASPPHHDVLDG